MNDWVGAACAVLVGGLVSRILVVDDESDLRYLLRRLLERDGHEVVEADNGRVALWSVGETLPDLVVTDVMMPVMGGGELIRALRADPVTAPIPIIVVTGYRGDQRFPADVVVVAKPFNLRPLLEAVNKVLVRKADPS